MKHFTLIMAILLAVITTFIIITVPIITEFSGNTLGLLCMLSVMGYVGSYLYFDLYTNHLKKEAFMAGYDAGSSDQYI